LSLHFQAHLLILQAQEDPFEVTSTFDGFKRFDFNQMIPIFVEILPPLQRAGKAGGRNFQKIRVRNQVVNLQDRAELSAYFSAILDSHPTLQVDVKS